MSEHRLPGRLIILVAAGALLTCGRSATRDSASGRLAVEYSGCQLVREGPVCVPADSGVLTLWVRADSAGSVRVLVGGLARRDAPVMVQGGLRFQVPVTALDRTVAVEATRGSAQLRWELALGSEHRSSLVQECRLLRAAGRRHEARVRLEQGLGSLGGEERASGTSLLARLELDRGEYERAVSALRSAVALHRKAFRISSVIDDSTALAYTLAHHGGRIAEARATLASAEDRTAGFAGSAFLLAYHGALLDLGVGDLRAAMRRLDLAVPIAERMELQDLGLAAEQVRARTLQVLGRRDEASAAFERLRERLPASASPCQRAQVLNNLAWARLLQLEAQEPAEAPLSLLEEAEALFDHGCPQAGDERVNVRINLALAQLHRGNGTAALAMLDQARALDASAELRFEAWDLEIRGRVALAQGRARDALRGYERLASLGRDIFDPDATWRAALGTAMAQQALGQVEAALASLARAEELASEATSRVALDEGRDSFAARHLQSTREYVRLLVRSARPDQALEVTRRARIRAWQQLARWNQVEGLDPERRRAWELLMGQFRSEQEVLRTELRDEWRLPSRDLPLALERHREQERRLRQLLDEGSRLLEDPAYAADQRLTPPAPGEVLLAFLPMGGARWMGFAADREGVSASELVVDAEAPPAALSAALLEPFASRLSGCDRVRVLPAGPLADIDFHALPWHGRTLLDAVPVVYSLDLPASSLGPGRLPPRALVVADPENDLPHARADAVAVRRSLEARPSLWQVVTLAGDEASPEELTREIVRADLLHFAGHTSEPGALGWEGALGLARHARLTAGEVLALPRVPAEVVLLGCQSGRSGTSPIAGFGLAEAFLIAGSDAVVSSSRTLDDGLARRVAARLYDEASEGPALDAALRRAVLAIREEDPKADWASLRVWRR